MVRELQAKQRYSQDNLRKTVANLAMELEQDEFIVYCFHGVGFYYAVTDKRVLIRSRGTTTSSPWSEVIGVGIPQRVVGKFLGPQHSFHLPIETMKGVISPVFAQEHYVYALRFGNEVRHALELHNTGEKDIRATILNLKPTDP